MCHPDMKTIEIRPTVTFPEPAFSRLQRVVFEGLEKPSDHLSATLRDEASHGAREAEGQAPMFRVGAYAGDELVGWSCGWMERGGTFYMATSGVVASHRRRGVYTALLDAIRAHAISEGAVMLRSQHCVLNNRVIIAKLSRGFTISGLSQSARMGTLVELVCHLSEGRRQMFSHRVLPYREVQ